MSEETDDDSDSGMPTLDQQEEYAQRVKSKRGKKILLLDFQTIRVGLFMDHPHDKYTTQMTFVGKKKRKRSRKKNLEEAILHGIDNTTSRRKTQNSQMNQLKLIYE